MTLEQFFDFEKSMFDLFTLAKRNEDFVVNDESNLSDLKKIEYKKFVNMLKRFNEDSDFNIYFVDNDLNVYIDESKANIFLFDNICIQCYYKEEYQFVDAYIHIRNCLE